MARRSSHVLRLLLLAVSLLQIPATAPAAELYRWDFDTPMDLSDLGANTRLHPGAWNFVRSIDHLRQESGALAFRVVAGDPYFYIDRLGIDAARWGYVVVVMKTTGGTTGQIYFAESEAQSLTFPVVADGRFHTYTVPLHRVPTWTGTIPILRFDPIDSGPAEVEIDSIAITDTPAGSYELSPPPPSRLILSAGARTEVEIGLLNTSGESSSRIEVELSAKDLEIAAPARQRLASLAPGSRQSLRWSVGADREAQSRATLRLQAAGEERREIDIDAGRTPTRLEALPRDGKVFVAADLPDAPSAASGAASPTDIPGAVDSLIVLADAGPATTVVAALTRAGGEAATIVLRLPPAAASSYERLSLPSLGAGWSLASARTEAAKAARPLRQVAFGIEPDTAAPHSAAILRLPTFTTTGGATGFIAPLGEPLPAAVRAHNFGAWPVPLSATFQILGDDGVVAETHVPLGLAPGDIATAAAGDLRPPQSGKFTLRLFEPASGLDLRLPLAVVARDHTWAATQREAGKPHSAPATLAADERPTDDAPIVGFESASTAQVDMLASELSPAVRLATKAATLTLFGRLDELGLGAPTHLAYASTSGPRVLEIAAGQALPTDMAENWTLFWFNRGAGWDKLTYSDYVQRYVRRPEPLSLDVPFLVVWQHRPDSLTMSSGGLEAHFPAQAGILALLPLFGASRLPQARTDAWATELPADVVRQVHFWSRALLAYPVHVREDFGLDLQRDVTSVRQTYRFHIIEDDWHTQPLRAAPISPSIALAGDAGFPVRLRAEALDTGCITPFGPYRVVPDTDTVVYDIEGVQRYVAEVPVPRADATPALRRARAAFVRSQAGKHLHDTDVGWFGGANASLAQGFKCAAVAYASPAQADSIRAVAQDQMSFFVLDDNGSYVTLLPDARRGGTVLVDTFNHVMRYAGDDAAGAGEILRGLWEYGYQCGDWDSVRRRFDRARLAMRFLSGEQTWIIESRPNSGGDTFHDVLLGLAAYARIAAVLGESEEYRYASYLFAKNLLAYFNYESASLEFARGHQPWIVPLVAAPMTTWDNYMDFGPFFTPLPQIGAYGEYSGFYEHYLRMGEGKFGVGEVLPRFHRDLLPGHKRWMFGEVMAKQVPARCHHPDPEMNRYCYQSPIDELRTYIGAAILREPAVSGLEADDDRPALLRTRLEALSPPQLRSIVPSAMREIPPSVLQHGVDADALGIGHGFLLAHPGDGRFAGLPLLSWFGLNAPGYRLEFHGGNLMSFGVFAPDVRTGAYSATEARPNWTTRTLHFEPLASTLSSPTLAIRDLVEGGAPSPPGAWR